MANKKPAPKSKTKSSSKTAPTIKPFDGKIVPFGSENKSKSSSSPKTPTSKKSSTPVKNNTSTSKTSTSKGSKVKTSKGDYSISAKDAKPVKPLTGVTNKKVVKKDGKVTVTYDAPYKSNVGTYDSKVRKIYDNKGNLIKGNQRVAGGYGSYTDIGIKGKKATSSSSKPSTSKSSTSKPSTSKSNPAYVKGVVEGLDRPQPKKKTEPQKPKAPKMATTIGSAKVSVPSKGKVKIEPNTGKPKSYTPPKVETKKVETKKVETKAAPKPELIKMETISSAKAAEQLMESRNIPTQLAGVNTSTPAPEEKKTRLERKIERRADRAERREERDIRREERRAEKDQENVAKMKKGGIMKYKTGGMVNPNAKLQADKKAGSKGVKHSLSVKAVVQKIAKGRSGGTNKPVARPKKG
jgi:hypothetical protein